MIWGCKYQIILSIYISCIEILYCINIYYIAKELFILINNIFLIDTFLLLLTISNNKVSRRNKK